MKKLLVLTAAISMGSLSFGQVKKTTTAAKPKPAAAIAVNENAGLKSNLDSFSYAIGINIANNIKQQGITSVNTAALAKAMDDVLNKKPTILNEQQCNGIIQSVIQEVSAKKNGAEKEKSQAFLESNKKRPEVITLPSGLQYEVLKTGNMNSLVPSVEDTVVAHYKGTLIDGKQFDNSYDRGEPLTIPVGGVIRGWTEILQKMHIGDKYKVYIPSELGYGENGAGADIPGGAALIFEMELIDVKKAAGNK